MKLSHPHSALRLLTNSVTALSALALISTASATLLVDPVGGSVIASSSVGDTDKDDGIATTPVFLDADFFGSPLANPFPTISFNGHIYFGAGDGDGDYFPVPFNSDLFPQADITRISPLWTDLTLGATSQVVQNVGADLGGDLFAYNSITWVNMQGGLGNEGFSATFQAIFFNAATILSGISFAAGDIAFSYSDIINYDVPADIMIGLDEGVGAFATLPGYEMMEGWAASYEDGMPFPVAADEYVHFRPDGDGSYDVTIEPIPEPSATAAALLGGVLLLARRRR